MFRLLRRLVILAAAAIALFVIVPAGARAIPATPAGLDAGVRGAIHIHTTRSDGTGSIDGVTAAAARAGLKFAIVTDHGDATREPDLPDYRNGVLYIDAVEISTDNGHVIALRLPKAPYPLRGEARDVLEDIVRLGGFAIAAHPGSAKPDLQWTDWNGPMAGLEWLNADSEWRDERPWTLARALIAYPFRPPQALAVLLDRPDAILRRWDSLTQQRRVIAVAGVDAHARVGVRTAGEPYDSSGSLHFPSYVNSFREFSIVLPGVRLSGDAAGDARVVIDAIRDGDVFSTIDALAAPAALRFTAASGGHTASMGEALPIEGPVRLRADAQAPADARIVLLRNGASIVTAEGAVLQHEAPAEAAVYRVEVTLPRTPGAPPVPWIVSNPIYIGRTSNEPPQTVHPAAPREFTVLYGGGPARGWTIEKSPGSDAAIDVVGTLGGSQLLLRFAISGTAADSPYAAFAMPATAAIAVHDRLVFTARADRPMRVSVQLRASAAGGEGERWHRSVYLDQIPRTIQLSFDDFRPRGSTRSPAPVLAGVQSILFVVDTVNTKIGSNGQVWIGDIKYAK